MHNANKYYEYNKCFIIFILLESVPNSPKSDFWLEM